MKMKYLFLGLALLGTSLFSQSIHSFGPVFNFSFPTEELSATHEIGYEIGGEINIDLGSPTALLHIAGYYNYFEGKVASVRDTLENGEEYIHDEKLPNYDLLKFVLGGKFFNENGFYILPAVTYAMDTGYERIGAEFGAGYAWDLFDVGKLEFGIKLAAINLIGKKEGEIPSRTINFGVAYMF